MKKNLVLSVLLLSATYSSADTYAGIAIGKGLNTDSVSVGTLDVENNYLNISLILGTGDDGGFKIQGRLNIISLDKAIYDNTHRTLVEIGLDGIKEFEITQKFYFYLKAGIAGGYIGIDDTYYDAPIAAESSLNAGIGLAYKLNNKVDLIAGADYVFRKYQDVEISYSTTISTKASGFEPYMGMRYSF